MNANEINYNDVFDVENTSANEQEVADPDISQNVEEGANAQEVADPVQTPDENSKYASARRRAEREKEQEVERVKQETKKEIDTLIQGLKLINPYNNSPITTREEYDAYLSQKQKDAQVKVQSAAGMTEKEFEEFKNSLPEVVEARETLATAKRERANARLLEEVKLISAFDPDVKTIEDIASSPAFEEVHALVRRGYDLSHAWKIVNEEALREKTSSISKQAAINSYNGKSHLTPTSSRGEGAVPVPSDVRDLYRAFNPDVSDAEITRHYNFQKK